MLREVSSGFRFYCDSHLCCNHGPSPARNREVVLPQDPARDPHSNTFPCVNAIPCSAEGPWCVVRCCHWKGSGGQRASSEGPWLWEKHQGIEEEGSRHTVSTINLVNSGHRKVTGAAVSREHCNTDGPAHGDTTDTKGSSPNTWEVLWKWSKRAVSPGPLSLHVAGRCPAVLVYPSPLSRFCFRVIG